MSEKEHVVMTTLGERSLVADIAEKAQRERTLLDLTKEENNRLWDYASRAVKGGFAGRHDSVESAYCAILFGLEVGLSMNQALQNVYVVNGRAALETEGMRSLVVARGYDPPVVWITDEDDQDNAVAYAKCRRGAQEVEISFSYRKAKRAGLMGKGVWQAYWDDMLKYKAEARALKALFPDILKGIACAEDLDESPPWEQDKEVVKKLDLQKIKGEIPWNSSTDAPQSTSAETSTAPSAPSSSGKKKTAKGPPPVSTESTPPTSEAPPSAAKTAEKSSTTSTRAGLPGRKPSSQSGSTRSKKPTLKQSRKDQQTAKENEEIWAEIYPKLKQLPTVRIGAIKQALGLEHIMPSLPRETLDKVLDLAFEHLEAEKNG